MKTILITDATGFIGSHLISLLGQQSWRLVAAVRNKHSHLPTKVKSIETGEMTPEIDRCEALTGIDIAIQLVVARAHILNAPAIASVAEFVRVNALNMTNLDRQSIAGVSDAEGIKGYRRNIYCGALTL
jgi:nucleoside-diphosphate-sugar epimerase